jgi:hypothetical protein
MIHVQVSLGGTDDDGGRFALVLALHALNGQDGSGFLVDNSPEARLGHLGKSCRLGDATRTYAQANRGIDQLLIESPSYGASTPPMGIAEV